MSIWQPDVYPPLVWVPPTVCRRPYNVHSYGRGPYGRCAIVSHEFWKPDSTPVDIWQPDIPWRRSKKKPSSPPLVLDPIGAAR